MKSLMKIERKRKEGWDFRFDWKQFRNLEHVISNADVDLFVVDHWEFFNYTRALISRSVFAENIFN